MNILVVYYSKSGNTKKLAQIIAEKLGADIDEIIDLKDRGGIKGWLLGGRDALMAYLTDIRATKNPASYDLVIVGTPIWSANATPAVRTYITQFKDQLKNIAIFTTSGVASPNQTVVFLEKILGKNVRTFTGWTEGEIRRQIYMPKLDRFIAAINAL